MESMSDAMIIGVIAGGGGVLLFAWLAPQKQCTACLTDLPKFRKPAHWRQALFGGFTCPGCGIELDRKGRPRG